MKKLFHKLENNCNQFSINPNLNVGNVTLTNDTNQLKDYIGKSFFVGKYNVYVEDIIAEGGFALVFLVKCTNINNNKYALKRMFVNNDHDLNICKMEISIANKVAGHKNCVCLIDTAINYIGEGVYEVLMLMNYYSNSLLNMMNEKLKDNSAIHSNTLNCGLFEEKKVLKIFCDICEAVAKLHENKIIHRDLKIENILISTTDDYVLCDFGSATNKIVNKLSSPNDRIELEEEIQKFTTLSYRSPEMVDLYSGQSITTKSDIWALGCLLYKLCFLSLPFGDSTLAIQNGNFIIPDNSIYSKSLHSLIKYMLKLNVSSRPDIYQVACLAFALAGKSCPIKNLNNSSTPTLDELEAPLNESDFKLIKQKQQVAAAQQRQFQLQNQQFIESTSVTPRQRPKPASTSNLNPTLSNVPVLSGPLLPRTPTPSQELILQKDNFYLNHQNNSNNSVTSVNDTSSGSINIISLNKIISAPCSTLVTPVTECNYSFNDSISNSNLQQSSTNPFTNQTFFSSSQEDLIHTLQFSPAAVKNSTINSSNIMHRRNASEASFIENKDSSSNTNNLKNKDIFKSKTNTSIYLSNEKISENFNKWNPFEDSFSNEQVIDHEFDEIHKRNINKQNLTSNVNLVKKDSFILDETDDDPFGSAPLDSKKIEKHLLKQNKINKKDLKTYYNSSQVNVKKKEETTSIVKAYINSTASNMIDKMFENDLETNNLGLTNNNINSKLMNESNVKKTQYDMFIDDEENRSSCGSGNYNEEFSCTQNLIKDIETDCDKVDSYSINSSQEYKKNNYFLNMKKTDYEKNINILEIVENEDNDEDDDDESFYDSNTSSIQSTSDESDYDNSDNEYSYSDSSDCNDINFNNHNYSSSDDEYKEIDDFKSKFDHKEKSNSNNLFKVYDKNISIDSRFVENLDGSKPLLEDEEKFDENEQKNEILKKNEKLIFKNNIQDIPIYNDYENIENNFSITEKSENNLFISNYSVCEDESDNISQIVQFSLNEETEYDDEVARNFNLNEIDQDLFGSKPFNQEADNLFDIKSNPQLDDISDKKQQNKQEVDKARVQVADISILSAIASTLAENQNNKIKNKDAVFSIKLPSSSSTNKKTHPHQEDSQQTSQDKSNENIFTNYGTTSPNNSDSSMKVILSTKSSKLPPSIRSKEEKLYKTKVKLSKGKLNSNKLKSSQKIYKSIECDDVDELLYDQDDLSTATGIYSKQTDENSTNIVKNDLLKDVNRTEKKKIKENKLSLSITSRKNKTKSLDLLKDEDKSNKTDKTDKKEKKEKKEKKMKKEKNEKKEKKKELRKQEKLFKKENKKLKQTNKECTRGFANMSFEDNIEENN